MLGRMSASEFTTLDLILKRHEEAHVEWLEISSISYYVLTERFVDAT
jgi:hypothetical protein